MITLGSIIAASFPEVVRELKRGGTWVSITLKAASMSGRLRLGEPTGDVRGLTIPMIWSPVDEENNATEVLTVRLAKSLIENLIDSHDDLLAEMLREGQTLVVAAPNYNLGPLELLDNEENPARPNRLMRLTVVHSYVERK